MKDWNVTEEGGKLIGVHSCRCDDEFQIFASRYYLQQMIPNFTEKFAHVKHYNVC